MFTGTNFVNFCILSCHHHLILLYEYCMPPSSRSIDGETLPVGVIGLTCTKVEGCFNWNKLLEQAWALSHGSSVLIWGTQSEWHSHYMGRGLLCKECRILKSCTWAFWWVTVYGLWFTKAWEDHKVSRTGKNKLRCTLNFSTSTLFKIQSVMSCTYHFVFLILFKLSTWRKTPPHDKKVIQNIRSYFYSCGRV